MKLSNLATATAIAAVALAMTTAGAFATSNNSPTNSAAAAASATATGGKGGSAWQGQGQGQQMTSAQLNEQQLQAANSADNGGSSNDNSTSLDPGSVISYTYVPNTIPQGVISNDAAITSGSVHVLDPLFGLSWQNLKTLPDGMNKVIAIANVALGAKPDGTVESEPTVAMVTARAVLCAHDPEVAAELAATASTFAACQ